MSGAAAGTASFEAIVRGLCTCSGVSVATDALSQVCVPNHTHTGVLGRPSAPSLDPSLILMYPNQKHGLVRSAGDNTNTAVAVDTTFQM